MRIIDSKHKDIYDYLQDPTDTLVFDRSKSFILTREEIRKRICWLRGTTNNAFMLIQCGVKFWLILLTSNDNFTSEKFQSGLLATWKNYDKPRQLIKVSLISFTALYADYYPKSKKMRFSEWLLENSEMLKDRINRGDYSEVKDLSKVAEICSEKYKGKTKLSATVVYDVPILKASGVVNAIDPAEMFYAIEEYFSLEKSDAERTEAIGTTNNDKITSHGFDLKRSFRGK